MANKKVENKARHALHKKKAAQKANQQAGKETDTEDEFEPWANPSISPFSSIRTS